MKKLNSIFLLTIYTSIALGITMNFHYCGGNLAKVSLLNIGGQVGCRCNPGDMPKDCCKDKLFAQKADNHRVVQHVSIADFVSLFVEPPPSYKHYISTFWDGYDFHFISNDSRRSCPDPIYLLNCVFRI